MDPICIYFVGANISFHFIDGLFDMVAVVRCVCFFYAACVIFATNESILLLAVEVIRAHLLVAENIVHFA